MALWIILGIYILAHVIVFMKHGIGGLLGVYIFTTGAWLYFYGYDSSFADYMYTNVITLTICTLGCFLPRGPLGIAVGGGGGYLLGRYLSKL